jgi:hypothetical protein
VRALDGTLFFAPRLCVAKDFALNLRGRPAGESSASEEFAADKNVGWLFEMNEKTKRGLEVLEAALLLGVLGDALLRATPWGLNVTLWMSALALALLALLARGRRRAFVGEARWLFLPLLFFSAAFAWRDSLTLQILDVLALGVTFSLMALRARGGRIRLAGVMEYATGGVMAGFNACFGAFMLLFGDIQWRTLPRAGWSRHVLAIVRGIIIAVPLVFIFGALLMAADAVFEGVINKSFRIDFNTLFSHAALLTFVAWTTAGFLRSALLGKEVPRGPDGQPDFSLMLRALSTAPLAAPTQPIPTQPIPSQTAPSQTASSQTVTTGDTRQLQPAPVRKRPSLGIVELGVVLGMLNLLFFSFVVIQIRYFFGGAAWVRVSDALTYAEYARRGFFELVWVAALVLPLLLAAHWLLRKENPAHERIFRLLAGMQVVLLFVIMTSAIGRMRLYQREYGLTELRLYTTAFMGWLALVFVWFAATVLRGQRERFACGALVTAFLMIAALHVMNPDALIVRVNVAHALEAKRVFDVDYAASLSADAVTALIESMPASKPSERCLIDNELFQRIPVLQSGDWRSWNWSRYEALSLLQEKADAMLAGCTGGDDMVKTGRSVNAFRH